MANMGYCRFENTGNSLDDCYDHMDDRDLSDSETVARDAIILLCKTIADEYGDEID